MRLTKIPLPPSINEYLRPSHSTKRFIKSEAHTIWEKKLYVWSLKNNATLQELRCKYQDFKGVLQVDLTFVFYKPRIIKKDGDLKERRLDVNNFLKSTLDALSKMIDVDDSRFNCHFVDRLYCINEANEQVIIDIKDTTIKCFEETF